MVFTVCGKLVIKIVTDNKGKEKSGERQKGSIFHYLPFPIAKFTFIPA